MLKLEVKPPVSSEYIEKEEQMEVDEYTEQMEVDNTTEDKKLKQEEIKEDEKKMKNFLGEPMMTCTSDTNYHDPSHQAAGIFTNSHQYQYSLYLPHLVHLMVMLYCVVIDSEDTLMSCL